MRAACVFLLSAVCAVFVGSSDLVADTVWNKQGVAIDGEVLADEPDEPLVFRCMYKGEWKTFQIPRDSIQKYTREAGDQSDGNADVQQDKSGRETDAKEEATGDAEKGVASDNSASADAPAATNSGKGLHRCQELRPLVEGTLPPVKSGAKEIVVLHLDGPFVGANIFNVGKTVSFGVLNVLMEIASERNPSAIVLRIDSGGGRVDQMDAIIERLLKEQDAPSNRRVVAWVDFGASAAALTALACKEIVMMPQGRLGAATRTYSDGQAVEEPETAVEQKGEAMREARRRQVAALTGRSVAIQDAMERPEHQFWHHPVLGFSLEEQDDDEWEAFDTDPKKPLALSAQAVVDLRIAVGLAGDVKGLLAALKLPADTQVVDIDLASPEFQKKLEPARAVAKAGNDVIANFKKRLEKEVDDARIAERAAAGILGADNGYTREEFGVFRSALANVQAPAVDPRVRAFLKESDPEMLAFYEDRLAMARRVILRAKQSTANAERSGSIAIGDILEDIRFAAKNLVEVLIDGEVPE